MNEIIKAYAPIVGIILLFVFAWIGYSKVISLQAEQRAIYERTATQMQQDRKTYMESVKSIKSAIESQDSIIKKYEKDLRYIKGQNEVLNRKYDNLPDIVLPEL